MLEAAAGIALGVLFVVALVMTMKVLLAVTALWAGVSGVNFLLGLLVFAQ